MPYAEYRDDPVGFFRDVLKIDPWPRQAEILESVAREMHVLVRSGHKIGKSLAAAGLALWWVHTREHGQVILTSAGQKQVKGTLWKEYRRLWRDARRRGVDLGPEPAIDPATGAVWADGRSVHGFTTASAEKMAGFSGHELLFIVDEASGFPDDIYEAVEGNLAGGGRVAAFGNPTQTTGWFFEGFRDESDLWHRIHVSSEEAAEYNHVVKWTGGEEDKGEPLFRVPGIATQAWVDFMRRKYKARTNPTYMIRVRGEFPEHASDAVIGLAAIGAAKGRWVENPRLKGIDRGIGIDVARFGDDDTVIQPVEDDYAHRAITISGADGPTVAASALRVIRELGWADSRVVVRIDGIGVGASVVDSLRLLVEQDGELHVVIVDIQVNEKADDADYPNLRSQLWFAAGEWLEEVGAIPPDDDDLDQELRAPRYGTDKRGRLQVESKDEIRKRIKRSPDRADALNLAVYRGRDATGHEIEPAGEDRVFGMRGRFAGGGIRGAFR